MTNEQAITPSGEFRKLLDDMEGWITHGSPGAKAAREAVERYVAQVRWERAALQGRVEKLEAERDALKAALQEVRQLNVTDSRVTLGEVADLRKERDALKEKLKALETA